MKGIPSRLAAPGVFYAEAELLAVRASDLKDLEAAASEAPQGRARLCAHRHPGDRLHEMIIALARGTYVPPHRHQGKPESFHVIQGRARVLLFDEAGRVTECLDLGEPASGWPFYLRIDGPRFHSLWVDSDFFVVHETTEGPWDPARTEVAAWAPPASDPAAGRAFLARALAALKEAP